MSAKQKLQEEVIFDCKEKQPQLLSGMYEDLKVPVKAVKYSCWVYFLILLSKFDLQRKCQTSCKCGLEQR